ncbi:hypothetical protein A2V82_02945 [candidate division KSB1 bacterium RBG_16_48_16]|nr:MAG: hypothetical protein A2V82_02945 [candidate division KSB1 bacterium RBG_16_48_16]
MPDRKRERVEIEIPSKAIRIKNAGCPNGHSLMDPDHKINGYPSVKVLIRYKDQEGLIYLDPIYGSFKNIHVLNVSQGDVVDFYCPECKTSLTAAGKICRECSSRMFAIHLPHGGIIEGCLKNGCHYHNLRLIDGNELLKKLDEEDMLDSYL